MLDATTFEEIREIRHRMFERRLHALIAGVILLTVALILGVVIAVDPSSSLVQGIDDGGCDGWSRRGLRSGPALPKMSARSARSWSRCRCDCWFRRCWHGIAAGCSWRLRRCGHHVRAVHRSAEALVDRPRPPNPLIGTSGASFSFRSRHCRRCDRIRPGRRTVPASRGDGWRSVLPLRSPGSWPSAGRRSLRTGSRHDRRACIGTGLALVWPAALELLASAMSSTTRDAKENQ